MSAFKEFLLSFVCGLGLITDHKITNIKIEMDDFYTFDLHYLT